MPTPVTLQLQLSPADIEAIASATVVQLREALKADMLTKASSMTVAEFAAAARVTVKHAHKLIQQGRVEATNPGGGDRRITAEAAARYFAGGKHGNAR